MSNRFTLSMNRRNRRQVLECGDGVCEVTALAEATVKWARLATDRVTPTENGDSADSVAAFQDASLADLIPTRLIVLMHSRKTGELT